MNDEKSQVVNETAGGASGWSAGLEIMFERQAGFLRWVALAILVSVLIVWIGISYRHEASLPIIVKATKGSSVPYVDFLVLVRDVAKKIDFRNIVGMRPIGLDFIPSKLHLEFGNLLIPHYLPRDDVRLPSMYEPTEDALSVTFGGVRAFRGEFAHAHFGMYSKDLGTNLANVRNFELNRPLVNEVNPSDDKFRTMGKVEGESGGFGGGLGGIGRFFGDGKRFLHINSLTLGDFEQASGCAPESAGKGSDGNSGNNDKKLFVPFNKTLNGVEKFDEKRKHRAIETLLIILGFAGGFGYFTWKVRREIDKISPINDCEDKNPPQDNEQPTRHD